MIGHQYPAIANSLGFRQQNRQPAQKIFQVPVVFKNLAPFNSTNNDTMQYLRGLPAIASSGETGGRLIELFVAYPVHSTVFVNSQVIYLFMDVPNPPNLLKTMQYGVVAEVVKSGYFIV
jgi:hypothetical protein